MTDETILDEATPEDEETPEPMPGNAPAPASEPKEEHGATDDPEKDVGAGKAGAADAEVPVDAF